MLIRNPHRLWIRLVFPVVAVGLFVLGYQWGNRVQRDRAEPPAIGGVLIRPPGDSPGLPAPGPGGPDLRPRRPCPLAGP